MHMIVSRSARDYGGWDRLARSHPVYLSAGWLDFVDNDGVADGLYLIGAVDGSPRVALSAHRTNVRCHPRYLPARVFHGAPSAMLTFGGRSGYLSGVLAEPGLSGIDVTAELAALIEAATDRLRAESWWWPYLPVDSAVQVAKTARHTGASGQAHLVAADYVIDVCGSTMDDHIAALATRGRRQNFRYEARAFDASSLVIRQVDIEESATELAALIVNVATKYGNKRTVPGMTQYLRSHAQYLGQHAVCFACFDNDTVIACAIALRWGDTLYSRAVGFDYPRLHGVGEYAQLSVHQNLRHCYEHGIRTLHLGLTAGQAKCSRGAYARPLWAITSRSVPARSLADSIAAITADMSTSEATTFTERVRRDHERITAELRP